MSHRQSDSDADTLEPDDTHYFDSLATRINDLETQQARLNRQIETLETLETTLREIDCDLGSASLSIDDEQDRIEVIIHTPDFSDPVRDVVDNYPWTKRFDVGYETRSGCLKWTLASSLTDFEKVDLNSESTSKEAPGSSSSSPSSTPN